MTKLSLTACAVIAVAITGCATPPPVEEDSAAATQAIEAAIAGYREAVLAGDVERLKGYLTEDGRFLEPGIDNDKAGMSAFITDLFSSGGKFTSLDLRRRDLFVHGDAAYDIGEYDEVVRMAGTESTVKGYYFIRWERGEDGAWRMDRVVAGPREAPVQP